MIKTCLKLSLPNLSQGNGNLRYKVILNGLGLQEINFPWILIDKN